MTERLVLTPGRRWALVIGLPFVLAAIGYTGLDYVSLVGQDSYRLQPIMAPAGNKVTVGVGDGNITVLATTGRQAIVTGTVNYSLVKPVLKWEHKSNGSYLAGPTCFWVVSCGAELTLAAPVGEAVGASSGSGNLTATNLTGAVNLNAGSGDIRLDQLSGALVLSDSSGNISGTELSGSKASVDDGSGNVDLSFERPPEMVTVSDASGNIRVALPANISYDISADASSGSTDVRVPTNPQSHHVIRLRAGSGNITVVPSEP